MAEGNETGRSTECIELLEDFDDYGRPCTCSRPEVTGAELRFCWDTQRRGYTWREAWFFVLEGRPSSSAAEAFGVMYA